MTELEIDDPYRKYIMRGYQNPIDYISKLANIPSITMRKCISEAHGWFIGALRQYCQRHKISLRESYRFDISDPDDFSWSTLIATIVINEKIYIESGRYGVVSTRYSHYDYLNGGFPPPYNQEKVDHIFVSALDTCARIAFYKNFNKFKVDDKKT